jgi:ammonia channel protein AmtB
MFKKLYLAFGLAVILIYALSTWFGWEFFNSGSRSRISSPFVWFGGGYRGGK